MTEEVHVYVGYDPSEAIAFHVLSHSIMRNASRPVAITGLYKPALTQYHKREQHPLQSTEFSFTRFLVPFLRNYAGKAMFMDCDMLVLGDVCKLVDDVDPIYPVSVVKHEHIPKADVKMLGQPQTRYEKKNWSSVMVFNCGLCKALTPKYVDEASGLELHQFKWLGERPIGNLPHSWNHLIGYDSNEPSYQINNLHWTEGGPWWEKYQNAPFAELWFSEKKKMEDAWERLK